MAPSRQVLPYRSRSLRAHQRQSEGLLKRQWRWHTSIFEAFFGCSLSHPQANVLSNSHLSQHTLLEETSIAGKIHMLAHIFFFSLSEVGQGYENSSTQWMGMEGNISYPTAFLSQAWIPILVSGAEDTGLNHWK